MTALLHGRKEGETMKKTKMCGSCDYCYSNETLNGMCICVNGDSEHCTEFVSELFDKACENYVNKFEDIEETQGG